MQTLHPTHDWLCPPRDNLDEGFEKRVAGTRGGGNNGRGRRCEDGFDDDWG